MKKNNPPSARTRTRAQEPATPTPPEITPEQAVLILHKQVDLTRTAFFRLAQVRAADLVKHEGRSWDEAGDYINREMASLDQQLGAAVG